MLTAQEGLARHLMVERRRQSAPTLVLVPMREIERAMRPATLGADGDDRSYAQWLLDGWHQVTTGLHRFVWGTGSELASGVVIPAEVKDPKLAQQLVADQYRNFGKTFGWPAAVVEQRVAGMLAAGVGATTVTTLERCVPFGPDAAWPEARAWYALVDEIMRAAASVDAGEAAGNVRISAVNTWEQAKVAADRVATITEKGATGLGMGFGVAVVGVALVAGAVAFWPELAAASAWKGRSR